MYLFNVQDIITYLIIALAIFVTVWKMVSFYIEKPKKQKTACGTSCQNCNVKELRIH